MEKKQNQIFDKILQVISKAYLKNICIFLISCILIMLFTYTGTEKLLRFSSFSLELTNQPLPSAWIPPLTVGLPMAELSVAIMLLVPRWRLAGWLGASLLLLIFTFYVGFIVLGAFDRTPCSCGGVFKLLSWELHFVINIVLTAMAFIGAWLHIKEIARQSALSGWGRRQENAENL